MTQPTGERPHWELCRAKVAAGAATAYDVARQLPWNRHERRLDDLDGTATYVTSGGPPVSEG